jgi:predicted metal-dependent phosphoesterase TrpH
VIDLHTHTTASDGRCKPDELVARAQAAGVDVLAVTDHDTVASCAAVSAACAGHGIEFVPGIEITSVASGVDVHVLGYFIDTSSTALHEFLDVQRRLRLDRIRQIVERLAALGMPLDFDAIVEPAVERPWVAIGRPFVARALVAARHVASEKEAFERWLIPGKPAFVPRMAALPSEVFARIHEAGGVASLAHPGLNRRDVDIPAYAVSGLDAIEAFHTGHDSATTLAYVALADRLNLAVTGGSDFHGDDWHAAEPGATALPRDRYEAFRKLRK